MVMDAIRLAGFTPTENGYRVAPHFPFRKFSLRLPRLGIASDKRVLRGYVVPERSETIELQVAVPAASSRVHTWAGGLSVDHQVMDGLVVFAVPAQAGMPADWAVTW
jgi:hypothetical protein